MALVDSRIKLTTKSPQVAARKQLLPSYMPYTGYNIIGFNPGKPGDRFILQLCSGPVEDGPIGFSDSRLLWSVNTEIPASMSGVYTGYSEGTGLTEPIWIYLYALGSKNITLELWMTTT